MVQGQASLDGVKNASGRDNYSAKGGQVENTVSSHSVITCKASSPNLSQTRGARQLPEQEYVRRRAEGRCFQCHMPFGPMHRCPEKKHACHYFGGRQAIG